MSELKQSINRVQINGTLSEINLRVVEKEVELKRNKEDKGTKVKCKVVEKVEFKNPAFVVEVNGNPIEIEYFGVNFGVAEKRLDENGEIIDNKNFKSLETIISNYNPKVGGNSELEPTRVKVDGKIGLNEYVSTNKNPEGDYISITQITAFGISSSGVSEEDSADAEISGVVYKVGHEVKNDEETGRLNIELISIGYGDVAEPYKFVVESDLADDFESFYEVGSSVKIYYEIISKQIGAVRNQTSGGFGRRNAKITSGYRITEYSVFSGEEPFEEEYEYYVSVDTIKEKLEEREVMIANKIKAKLEEPSNTNTSSPKGASANSNNPSPFGTKGSSTNPFGGGNKKQNPFG